MSGKWIVSQRIPTRCARCSSLARCRRSSRWGGICCRQSRQASTGSWFWSNLQKKIPFMCSYKVFFSVTLCRATSISAEMQRNYCFIWNVTFLCFLLRQWVRWCRTAPTCSLRGTCSTGGWTGRGPARKKNTFYSCRTLNFPPTTTPKPQRTFEWNKLRHHWERPVVAGILPGKVRYVELLFF